MKCHNLRVFWVNIDIFAKKIDKDHVCRLIPELVPGWETEHQEEGNKHRREKSNPGNQPIRVYKYT